MVTRVVKREQATLVKKSAKRKAAKSDRTSDSDRTVHHMEQMQSILKKVPSSVLVASEKDKFDISSDAIAEEKKYQKRVAWLHDHGESAIMDFHCDESIDVSVEDSSMNELKISVGPDISINDKNNTDVHEYFGSTADYLDLKRRLKLKLYLL